MVSSAGSRIRARALRGTLEDIVAKIAADYARELATALLVEEANLAELPGEEDSFCTTRTQSVEEVPQASKLLNKSLYLPAVTQFVTQITSAGDP